MSGARRKLGFTGGYLGDELKRALKAEASSEHRNLSQHLMHILEAHLANRNVERDACAKAVCKRCRAEWPEWDSRHELFYHSDGVACLASKIHERGLSQGT